MQFILGTHMPHWVRTPSPGPLFLSAIRLRARPVRGRAATPWALDSGGFTELNKSGRWTVSPQQYADEVRRWASEMGGLKWAATQDWMCEPFVLQKTGLTVTEHQRRTVRSWLDLTAIAPEVPWVPVLQGWEFRDYLDHFEMYAREGLDLAALPLVGLGSVCRRQHTRMAEELIRELHGRGVRVHGFGFKIEGLRRCSRWLHSADSLAWSFQARKTWRHERRRLCRGWGDHAGGCASCQAWAERWRGKVLEAVAEGTRPISQPCLF